MLSKKSRRKIDRLFLAQSAEYAILVGVWPTPLKNMSSSDWIIIPNLVGENKIHVPNHQPDIQFGSKN